MPKALKSCTKSNKSPDLVTLPLGFHSHNSGCYGVANAHGPSSSSQQEVSIIQPFNFNGNYLFEHIHLFSGVAFSYFYLVSANFAISCCLLFTLYNYIRSSKRTSLASRNIVGDSFSRLGEGGYVHSAFNQKNYPIAGISNSSLYYLTSCGYPALPRMIQMRF